MQTLCTHHEHVMPARDDSRERSAVNKAITEVLGALDGQSLDSFKAWKAPQCHLPDWQALLVWVRDTMPEQFPTVLRNARAYAR